MAAESVERTVKAVVTTYLGADGVPRVGLRGEKVEVSKASVKEFDAGEGEVPPLADDKK